nr:MAG: capsid protein [Crogonang virus 3]
MDTITFREDGDVASDVYAPSMADLSGSINSVVADATERGIMEYLRRPVILSQGTWNTVQASTVSLGSWSFPDALLGPTFTTQLASKLLGYTLMRGKIRVRLQVNSQPSYAGILLLSYVPHADYMTSKVNSLYSTLTSLTGCTHVTMNLASATSMEFVTPYISPHLFANLVTGQGTFGRLNLQVLSPLTIGAGITTPVTWTLWVNFEDVELRFPSNGFIATAYAQIGGETVMHKRTGLISGGIGTVGRVVSGVLPALGLGALSQPVEALASSASGIARFFGFSKPSIQAPSTIVVQKPTRGHLNIDGADTSHKLGASVATELQTLSGFAGTDEDEMSLSYVVSRPSAIDSFSWLTSATQDTVLATYRCTPSALIWRANNVTPAVPRVRNAEVRMTHAAFVADKYAMWRGDIVYSFHFAKTQLHSGRVRVNFKPYVGDLFPVSSVSLNECPGFTMTEDVDLSTCSTFRFRVPYVSSRPWMLTEFPQFSAPGPTLVDAKNFSLGELEIVVLNQLTAMSTVSNSVNVVVFAHMENAAFAVPRRSATLPNLAAAPAALLLAEEFDEVGEDTARRYPLGEWKRSKREVAEDDISNDLAGVEPSAVAQIGGEEAKKMTDTQQSCGVEIMPAAMCQGEIHTSLRQLLKRYNLVGYVAPGLVASTATNLGSSGDWWMMRPWAPATNAQLTLNTSTAENWATKYNDIYSAVYGNYAFFRGSMRFRIVFDQPGGSLQSQMAAFSVFLVYPENRNPNSNPMWARAEEYPVGSSSRIGAVSAPFLSNPVLSRFNERSNTGAPIKTPPSREINGWESIAFTFVEGAIEFEVPYYSTGHMSTARYFNYNGDFWASQRNGVTPLPLVVFGSNYLTDARFRVYRAVGDDFSFGGLVGVPRSTKVLEPGPQAPGTDMDDLANALNLGPNGTG